MSYGSMMAVARSRDNDNTRRDARDEGRMGSDYGMRDNRMGAEYDGGHEMAFRDRTGRRHYDNGRFAPMRSGGRMADDDDPEMNMGFMRGGENPRLGNDEPRHRRSREMGRASVYENDGGGWVIQGAFGGDRHRKSAHRPMDEAMAEAWTRRMRGEDGETGPHWAMEQIQQLIQQKKELQEYDPAEVFAVMNMMYSDYSKPAKKFGVNTMDFYVCMAKAWLDDPDAPAGKTARYYECVVNG